MFCRVGVDFLVESIHLLGVALSFLHPGAGACRHAGFLRAALMSHDFFSTAQMFGHAALILSMMTFSRKNDRHFRILLTGQNLLLAIHFFLLGNPAGAAGSTLSATRNVLSLRTRSLAVALILLAANVLLGFWVVKTAWNVIPLLATAVATIAMFRLQGLHLRYAMLLATLLWLTNNILSGSIGATVMEVLIAIMSCVTIFRLHRDRKRCLASASCQQVCCEKV